MTIQTVSQTEAFGIFDGLSPTLNPSPIIKARGIQAYDPTTTPADPVGGFTRNGISDYLIKMTLGMDFSEGVGFVQCLLGKPNPNLCMIIGPGTGTDGDVAIVGNGVNDTLFYLGVFRVDYDADGGLTPNNPNP